MLRPVLIDGEWKLNMSSEKPAKRHWIHAYLETKYAHLV